MKNLTSQNLKCLLVQCQFSEFSFWNYTDVCEVVGKKYPAAPLGIITTAGLLPQNWEFKLVDENVEALTNEHLEWADLICTGGMLSQQKSMLDLIDRAKAMKKPIAVGGPDPTAQPDIYKKSDYLVLGEGEITIPMFLKDLEKGKKKGLYSSKDMADMTKTKTPRFDLLKFDKYLQIGIQFSRGCPFNCEFCDIIELFGRKTRTKTAAQIIDELQTLYDLGYRGHVDFVDDNLIGNKKTVKVLLQAVLEWSKKRKHPFYFSTEASINLADDDELLRLMQTADFRYVFIGIETPDDELLKQMQKKQNVNKPLSGMIRKIMNHGMVVNGGFIMGFDSETEKTATDMIRLIEDTGVVMAMVGMLYALPRTQLTRRLEKEGRLFKPKALVESDKDIDQLTSGLNFVTKRPRLEVLKDYARVIREVYEPRHYFDRVFYTSTHTKVNYKFKPSFKMSIEYFMSFLKVSKAMMKKKKIGGLYWKLILKSLFTSPKSVEVAVNLAAMYLHFGKQSQFIINLVEEKIADLEKTGEKVYNSKMMVKKTVKQRGAAKKPAKKAVLTA